MFLKKGLVFNSLFLKILFFLTFSLDKNNIGCPQGCVQSDIDVLVEFNKLEKSFDNYMELKFYLEKLFHRRVDLVIREALKPRIRQHILKEVIYARL